jgi:hypothetical protein
MSTIVTDLAVKTPWVARRGVNNTFQIAFTLSSVAYNISSFVFSLVSRRFGATSNLITLTEADGLTNGGASGILVVELSKTNTELVAPDTYYYELRFTLAGKEYVWFHSSLKLLSETSDETVSTSITVPLSLAGTLISASVTVPDFNGDIDGGSAITNYQADQIIDGGSA